MKKQLEVSLETVNDAVRLHASAPDKNPIVIDYFSPPGDEDGYSSLELLLMSAASCLATAVKLMATRRLEKEISAIEVKAVGIRRDALPTDFEKMTFALRCVSKNLDQAALDGLVQTAEKSVCPVFAMLRSDVPTEISAVVVRPDGEQSDVEGGAK